MKENLISFASKLISSPSPNPPGDERAVAGAIRQEAEKLGLPEPEILAKREERPNLLFRIGGGRPGRTLLYAAHMDTKPVGESSRWETNPFEPVVKDGCLYGLGASDVKGSIAAMLYAAAQVKEMADGLRGQLLLVFTADEEKTMEFGAKYLAEECGLRADAALLGEPNGISEQFEYIPLLSRGLSCFKVKVYGDQGHSSLSDRMGFTNASAKMSFAMSRMAKELRLRAPSHPVLKCKPVANVGVKVQGGVGYGVYPGYGEFGVEVRLVPGMTPEGLRDDVEGFLDGLRREDRELKIELEFEPPPLKWFPPTEVSPDEPLVQALSSQAELALGRRLPYDFFPGGTEARFFQGVGGIPTIPAFGPGLLSLAHGPNEHVPLASIAQAARVYAATAAAYLQDPMSPGLNRTREVRQ
jgi:acetylornithine deacetylase